MRYKIESFDIKDKRFWVLEADEEQDAWEYFLDNILKLEDDGEDFFIREVV